eukprot:COSAG01_NODE_66540_length_269_cov_12.111765_1_plen_57_part_01
MPPAIVDVLVDVVRAVIEDLGLAVVGYGIVAAAAACMPACSEGITAVIAPLGTENQV